MKCILKSGFPSMSSDDASMGNNLIDYAIDSIWQDRYESLCPPGVFAIGICKQ